MATYGIYALGASQITVSGGGSLSGITRGDGAQLSGRMITLNSNAWQEIAIRDNGSDTRFADNDGSQRLDGAQTFDGVTYSDNRVVEAEYRVTVTDGTNTYTMVGFNIREPGAPNSFGTTEGLAFLDAFPPVGVPLTVVSRGEGPSNSGGGATEAATYATPPCFASGTRIAAPGGARAVETLRPGDRVATRDSGAAPIRWTGTVRIGAARMAAEPSLRPVRIRAGAFGPGRPARDLVVSQQHRILVGGPDVALLSGEEEALAAAVHLVDGRRVVLEAPAEGVTYHHLLLARHEIVTSEGLETESFLPGPMTLPALGDGPREELLRLFPELRRRAPLEAARPLLRGWEARLVAA